MAHLRMRTPDGAIELPRVVTLLYIGPWSAGALRRQSMRRLYGYVSTLARLTRRYCPGQTADMVHGLELVARRGHPCFDARLYQVARARAMALCIWSTAAADADSRACRHPIESVPDALWPN